MFEYLVSKSSLLIMLARLKWLRVLVLKKWASGLVRTATSPYPSEVGSEPALEVTATVASEKRRRKKTRIMIPILSGSKDCLLQSSLLSLLPRRR